MAILGGTNGSSTVDYTSRKLTKLVDTGWSPSIGTASDILSLWGLKEVGATNTDTYVLSMSYSATGLTTAQLQSGSFCLASKDSFGHWVNAVDQNIGGARQFVFGPYSSTCALGAYGVDTTSGKVWAVVNHQGDFAAALVSGVVNFLYTSDNHYGIIRPIFQGGFNVSAQAVNEAMIAKMNTIPAQTFPADGGVAAGQTVGQVDFLVTTGDLANRSETNSSITAKNFTYLGNSVSYPGSASYVTPVSAVTWSQFQNDYLGTNNTGNRAGGLLALTNSLGQGIPVFLSPGNHDISDALGMTDKINAANVDATSYVQIYNRMTPYSGKAPITNGAFSAASYTNLLVNYSFDIGGVHVMSVNMFPDKNVLNWMSADIANVPSSTPVLVFCHAPLNMAAGETKIFGNPATPTSTAAGDIPFTLSGVDGASSYVDMNAAKQYVADWLMTHPNVRGLLSGHDNFNGSTNWNGQDPNGTLIASRDAVWSGVPLFRVDSPMKGDISGTSATDKIGVETNLSFQVYSFDLATRRLTEREYLYDSTGNPATSGAWGQSTTVDLNVNPLNVGATLAGPINGTVITSGAVVLNWNVVPGATYYQVSVTSGATTEVFRTIGTSLTLPSYLANGSYTWTVTAVSGTYQSPASLTGSFTLNLPASSGKWSFGVMDDTQWTTTNGLAQNSNYVPLTIISQINSNMINAGVKFVVQVGDLTENGNDADELVRANAAQPLLNAGIGFFPMRGNHETYGSPANNYAIPAFQADYPQTQGLTNTFGAANFSSPISVSSDLNGMSYTFDYANARFMVLDNWVTPSKNIAPGNGYNYGYSFGDQQAWITGQLASRAPAHAFVFSHQPLMAENHQDSPFVGYTDANTNMQNAFYASLATNGVRYYISGHDHIHQRSLVASPDGQSVVQEIIGASDSSKFYTPKATNDGNWKGQKYRETSISQDRYTVGYYIYTVDGPRVTVDYYADDHGNWLSDNSYPGSGYANGTTPSFHFVKKETWGYSLNGIEFQVAQGASYATNNSIAAGNGFQGTAMAILGGTNGSSTVDYTSRKLTRLVDTGWTTNSNLFSDVLSLWGMTEVGATNTDPYVLSMTYSNGISLSDLQSGEIVLVEQNTNGGWVKAVDLNVGGDSQFVFGPYVSSYTLGTYGVDATSGTVWAVVNHDGNFAVSRVVRRADYSALRIATLSDMHYFATNLLVTDGVAFQTYLAGDRKLLAQSAAIAQASVDAVISQNPDVVLVTGDLTKDGEYDSHIGMSNQLARLAAAGAKVFVIPGNHDVNNTNAKSFNGANTTPVPNVTPDQFASIYAPFGFNQAIDRDPSSLSYVVEPTPGLWILAMDSCQYAGGGLDPTAGSFDADRLGWITNKLIQARSQGKMVVGMMHHGLMEHFQGQATLFPQYVLTGYQTVAPLFASLGLRTVFTGHFHANDIVQGTYGGNTIYDIETGSTVTWPCPYRVMDLQTNWQFDIATRYITAINYNLAGQPDFPTYAYNYLTSGMVNLSAYMLQGSPFYLSAATAAYLAPAVTEALVDHYAGDEPGVAGATPATQTVIGTLLSSGNAQQIQIGQAIAAILIDPAPADNNVTLNFASPDVVSPTNGATITSGAATLAWSAIPGTRAYTVTLVSGGVTTTLNSAATSVTLPANLANGSYT